jgi:hypothetical protein
MREAHEVRTVTALSDEGVSMAEISRRTGIPWSTVRNWCSGRSRSLETAGRACPRCRQLCLPIDPGAGEAYSYLLGQYLGDGGIYRHRRDVYRLVIFGDAAYPAIADETATAIRTVAPHVSVRRSLRGSAKTCLAVDAYSRSWPCLFPQHGPGTKHERPIVLTEWQRDLTSAYPEALVRGLIHSDGGRAVNVVKSCGRARSYPRYTFSNRSDDIRSIFCQHLDLLGIPWRRMNRFNISVAKRDGRDEIEQFLLESGFEATGYTYTAVDDEYVVVTAALRRRLPTGGLADSTLAMVFKVEGDEIVCIDAFPSADAAFASLAK